MPMRKRLSQKLQMLLLGALMLLLAPVFAGAQEVIGTAYKPDELAKVKEWEKTWVGKKIDKSNVDQIAAYFPESYVGMIKDPEKWGAPPEGLFFNIVAYQPIPETKGFCEATKKYSPMVKKNPDGTITNYAEIAGRPFPEPKDGMEAAYNFEFNNHGDSCKYRRYSPTINPSARNDRLADQEYTEFFFIHRTEKDPLPAITPNEKGMHRAYFLNMFKPAEFLNTRMFNVRYIDPKKEDDAYLWYSQFRRIRRMSTAQRADTIDGSDMIYDDEYLWDGQFTRNTYTLKGKKDLLSSRHTDLKTTTRISGQALSNGMTLERCNTLVIDAINKDPNYIYSKRVWYLDPETAIILWTELYDQNGKFWKCFLNNTCPVPTKIGQMKPFIVGTQLVEFQRTHAGLSHQEYFYKPEVTIDVKADIFTVGNLQKTY
jgi:hypothetical protein